MYLPKKWERLGDIIIVKLDPKVAHFGSLIAGIFQTILFIFRIVHGVFERNSPGAAG